MTEKIITPLKKLREARGLKQTRVAELIGIDQSTLARIEAGEGAGSETAEKLVKFYGSAISEAMILYPERFPDYQVSQQ